MARDKPTHLATKAFLGDPKIKAKYIARVEAHAAADEIVQGKYQEITQGA